MRNRGFIGVGVLLAILAWLIFIGGGAYYIMHQNSASPTQTASTTENSPLQQTKTGSGPVHVISPVPGSIVGFDIRATGEVPLSWHIKNGGIIVILKREDGTMIQSTWTPVTRMSGGYAFSVDFVEGGGMAGELTPYEGPAEIVITGTRTIESYSVPIMIKASGVNAF